MLNEETVARNAGEYSALLPLLTYLSIDLGTKNVGLLGLKKKTLYNGICIHRRNDFDIRFAGIHSSH